MAQGNNNPFKDIRTFKLHQEKLKNNPNDWEQQIRDMLELAKAKGSEGDVYIGFPFEAKNAPFKLRAIPKAVKEFA